MGSLKNSLFAADGTQSQHQDESQSLSALGEEGIPNAVIEPGFSSHADHSGISTQISHPSEILPHQEYGNDNHKSAHDEEEIYRTQVQTEPSAEMTEGTEDSIPFIHPGVFPFMKLPRELRDRVYKNMLRPTMLLKDLTGKTSDWFNPAILRINRQINAEAAMIIYKEQIEVTVNLSMVRHKNGVQKMPGKSLFRRCLLDLDLSDPRIKMLQKEKIITAMISSVWKDMKGMAFLKELQLSFRGTTNLIETHKYGLFPFDEAVFDWDHYFATCIVDCFREVPSVEKIIIGGELEEAYTADLRGHIREQLIRREKPYFDLILKDNCIHWTLSPKRPFLLWDWQPNPFFDPLETAKPR